MHVALLGEHRFYGAARRQAEACEAGAWSPRPIRADMNSVLLGSDTSCPRLPHAPRLARSHGFQRAAGKIREIVLSVIPQDIGRTEEDGCLVFWPEASDPGHPFPLRESDPEVPSHGDIPVHELASLAADGDDKEAVIRLMAEKF